MRIYAALFVVFATVYLVSAKPQNRTNFEKINVDEILSNDRILRNYIKCMLDKGPCTSDGKDFKRILPDVLETMCAKCSENENRNMKKVTNHIYHNKPNDWKKLMDKYDKDNKYRDNIQRFLEE